MDKDFHLTRLRRKTMGKKVEKFILSGCVFGCIHILRFCVNLSILWALACLGATIALTHHYFYANVHNSDNCDNAKKATYPRCVLKKYNPFNYNLISRFVVFRNLSECK